MLLCVQEEDVRKTSFLSCGGPQSLLEDRAPEIYLRATVMAEHWAEELTSADEVLSPNDLRLSFREKAGTPSELARYENAETPFLEEFGTLFGAKRDHFDLSTACLPKNVTFDDPQPPSIVRMELPMLLNRMTVSCKPDSGSEENVMCLELVNLLGLVMDCSKKHQQDFKVGNGKTVHSIGCAYVNNTTFVKDKLPPSQCAFYVLPSLIFPAIVGMKFLDQTATLSRHRYRLQAQQRNRSSMFKFGSLDYPKRRLGCLVNSHPELVNADTGSELDLMSLDYVRKRGFVIDDLEPDTPKI